MCGIVGLLAKTPEIRNALGMHLVPMLGGMASRGEDSAGLAIFGQQRSAARRLNLLALDSDFDWAELSEAVASSADISGEIITTGNHAILTSGTELEIVRGWLGDKFSRLALLSNGYLMDVYKDVGHPLEVAAKYGFEKMTGTHALAHTRMATESAVTPLHAHPFVSGDDFSVVHNGSLSNPNGIRRMLAKYGISFETDNDTEAAARLIQWRLSEGDSLGAAMNIVFEELDGFFTLLMADEVELALVRDAFACKPAVVAETDDYVAVASEFQALSHLPGINNAEIFEPKPEEIYVWKL
jgi:amidophosphoribosyltransferase